MGCFSFSLLIVVAIAVFTGSFRPASAQTSCPVSVGFNGTEKSFANCTDLRSQASTLSWSFKEESNSSVGILDVAFRTTLLSTGGWAGWGINLVSANDMIGTNALIAFDAANGSNVLLYKVTAAQKSSLAPLVCSPIDITVLSKSVQIVDLSITIFSTIRLPPNLTVIHQFWNRGTRVTNFQPETHPTSGAYLSSFSSIDVSSGAVSEGTVDNSDQNTHGILNVVGWGLLLPLGVLTARYLRQFTSSVWFYMHVSIQLAAFIIGVAGFSTGLKMGGDSSASKHRSLGITIFTLAVLQITALGLRPKPDHKLRRYWNVYHHGFGYIIITLVIVNIFEGFELLQPDKKYRNAYIGVICALAAVALVLELATWALWLRKRSKNSKRLESDLKAINGHRTADPKGASHDGQFSSL
ncbi:hypothetical protein R1flu_010197 [Riccia fluitans]|uniref:Cytochrome b561 and DOMON domain-containing protein n=1 Tax=Riccia fluitans TaxID=41844 RepID=A0ABD1Z4G5_9MARC